MVQTCIAAVRHSAVTDDMFISQKFELRFIFKFCFFTFLGGLLFSSLILFYCNGSLTTSFDCGRLAIRNTSLVIFPGVLYTNLIMLFMAAIICLILICYLSHRIRKPLFRFREDVKAIAEGDLTIKVRYRNQDLTTTLAQNINVMTSRLNLKMCEVETGFQELIDTVSDNHVPGELTDDLIRIHRSIKQGFIL